MTLGFFRYPHTPHIAWLGEGQPRDDKVLSTAEVEALLSGDVVVEEKLDGANVGLSVGESGRIKAQNRGQYLSLPQGGQFGRLDEWIEARGEAIAAVIPPQSIIFGEWCAARHSLAYDNLPDWWMIFDIYHRQHACFLSTNVRHELVAKLGLAEIQILFRGRATLKSLMRLLSETSSSYRSGPMEGIVIRSEIDDVVKARAKLVQPEFTQAMGDHWRRRRIEWNFLK
jgi:ATP-dependent RNA circularization protein (DNA/RNA ligase family)